MLIDTQLLSSYGGTTNFYYPKDFIHKEGEIPNYYYQIISGYVKLNHNREDGKELIQGILTTGQSICEQVLFIDEEYPLNAVAITECSVMKVPKSSFLKLLNEHPQTSEEIRRCISERLHYKFIMVQKNSSPSADVRIKGMLTYFKSFSDDQTPYSYEVLLTRQQLAAITNLRIETVIRSIKKLEREKIVKIIKGKVFF